MHHFLLLFLCSLFGASQSNLLQARNSHSANELTVPQLRYLAKLSNSSHVNKVLDNILIPRVVGTKNHEKVRNYIVKELENLGWNIEIDAFEDKTPLFGKLTFSNVIATLNPSAERFLVLACHYDSKYFEKEEFVGATDSAVPCAMMLNLAYVMSNELQSIKNKNDVSLKFIFFDGEEAFENWGPDDSIYGAKHLAQKLHLSKTKTLSGEPVTDLNRIDILMLLDLIGTPYPRFHSFFSNTEKWYMRLVRAEQRLANMGQLKQNRNSYQPYFTRRTSYSYVEDDHIPFLKKDVPILHLIPTPFPNIWHTPKDDRSAIDMETVENINKILRVFVSEYLHISLSEDVYEDGPHNEL